MVLRYLFTLVLTSPMMLVLTPDILVPGARRSESNSVVLQWNTTSALFEQIQMLPSVVPSFPCPVLIYLSRYVNQYRYALIVASYAGPVLVSDRAFEPRSSHLPAQM